MPKLHIVRYRCDECGAEETCEAGLRSDGMCSKCGSPMKIEDLFTDRRVVSLPVSDDRRDEAA